MARYLRSVPPTSSDEAPGRPSGPTVARPAPRSHEPRRAPRELEGRRPLPEAAYDARRKERSGASRHAQLERPAAPGGSAIATPANVVTLIRIAATFLWIAAAQAVGPGSDAFSPMGLLIALFFGAIAFTDTLDGYLARSRNEVTAFGAFIDPIADKIICVGALLVLLQWGLVNVWVPVVVIGREFLVSGLRMVVAAKGEVISASWLGKWKTGFTMGAIAGYLVGISIAASALRSFVLAAAGIAMLVAVVLTLWSGVDYLVRCWKYLR